MLIIKKHLPLPVEPPPVLYDLVGLTQDQLDMIAAMCARTQCTILPFTAGSLENQRRELMNTLLRGGAEEWIDRLAVSRGDSTRKFDFVTIQRGQTR